MNRIIVYLMMFVMLTGFQYYPYVELPSTITASVIQRGQPVQISGTYLFPDVGGYGYNAYQVAIYDGYSWVSYVPPTLDNTCVFSGPGNAGSCFMSFDLSAEKVSQFQARIIEYDRFCYSMACVPHVIRVYVDDGTLETVPYGIDEYYTLYTSPTYAELSGVETGNFVIGRYTADVVQDPPIQTAVLQFPQPIIDTVSSMQVQYNNFLYVIAPGMLPFLFIDTAFLQAITPYKQLMTFYFWVISPIIDTTSLVILMGFLLAFALFNLVWSLYRFVRKTTLGV